MLNNTGIVSKNLDCGKICKIMWLVSSTKSFKGEKKSGSEYL